MWKNNGTYTVSGLYNVGFASGRDLILVLSAQGQGIFDCTTGLKVASDYKSDWWDNYNQTTNTIAGFDCLQNIKIHTCGLYNPDNLLKITQDGWTLEVSEPEPDYMPFENYLVQKIYLVSPNKTDRIFITNDGPCELRALGFSDTGNSFIVALSCEIIIYSRE
ncbi:hypothetical protein [Flavobacterium subsaxonicum]|uniref:Uncharacterized protein n=1 Tax=Flavobacterium subsaxonicum WB 4.1-42 = DSM 21790 TaxID=1121898 RepID=A0A0A2MJ73_9FLAO|nr:hypothetical protein [Flavobacterium subsaxonicum]KGO92349.1 hypothetical protein Q766_12840 [Flavobacterium subsaxonicum WB 4.1-42 = DSM 21790]